MSAVYFVSFALYEHKMHFLDWVSRKLDFLKVTLSAQITHFTMISICVMHPPSFSGKETKANVSIMGHWET